MDETSRLIAAVKRLLRRHGLTYRDVAAGLDLSEASVKRLFASQRLTLDRLARLAGMLGLSLAELAQEAAAPEPGRHALGVDEEAVLVTDAKLLLVTVCALNHWTHSEITATYRITEAETIERLVRLERLRLIDLLPGNRIRIVAARDFDWLPNGPIQRYFRAHGQEDFLSGEFSGPGESLLFLHGMLTADGLRQLRNELERLRLRFADLHGQALSAPFEERRGSALLLAARPWEPRTFAALRR